MGTLKLSGDFKGRYLPWGELPQNILGRISSRVWKTWLNRIDNATLIYVKALESQHGVKIYVVTKDSHQNHFLLKGLSGHALGKYICVVYRGSHSVFIDEVKHELGHTLQSKDWKWLYLLAVGVPSVMRNLWNRWHHGKWPPEKSDAWYYSGWPENDADKRGGVIR